MIEKFKLFSIEHPLQIEQSTLEGIIKQLEVINENLSTLTKAVTSQSFWNSQVGAAIIGAAAAIFVILIQQFWNWRKKRKEKLDKIYEWIAEKYHFWTPRSLYDQASSTSYGGTSHDTLTGETKKIPEKSLGEKMVIELRSHVKYWRFPSYRLKSYFKKYEASLIRFNSLDQNGKDQLQEFFSISEEFLSKIKDMAFRESGENEYTI